jgi:hypothetical protein
MQASPLTCLFVAILMVGCAAWANSMHKVKQHVVKRQNNNSINRFASCMIV